MLHVIHGGAERALVRLVNDPLFDLLRRSGPGYCQMTEITGMSMDGR